MIRAQAKKKKWEPLPRIIQHNNLEDFALSPYVLFPWIVRNVKMPLCSYEN